MSERELNDPISRRDLIKKGLVGAAGLTALPALIAACNAAGATTNPTAAATPRPPTTPTATASPKLSGQLRLANGLPDTSLLATVAEAAEVARAEKAGMDAIGAAFEKLTGLRPTLNTLDNFQIIDQTKAYLEGTPEDLFTGYSGYRMHFYAAKGLILPIDEVWNLVKDNFTPAVASAVTADDGHIYGVPVHYSPRAMFYRRSVWAKHGYQVPTTWDQLLTLCARMKKDGLTPIAFGDGDGWPSMETFDILDLRLNGYQFHIDLLKGAAKWTDNRVAGVLKEWRKLVPFYTDGFQLLTWQKACDTLTGGQAGMYHTGLFMTGEVTTVDESVLDDIDFFEFPYFGNEFDAERAVEAQVEVWAMAANSPTLKADRESARAYLEFLAQGSTQLLMYQAQPRFLPTASDIDASKLDRLSAKFVQMASRAQHITNFFASDTSPYWGGHDEMQSFLVYFLRDPGQDLTKLQQDMQRYWDLLPPYLG
jgi:multiple sugar transport system substrate-binding protein